MHQGPACARRALLQGKPLAVAPAAPAAAAARHGPALACTRYFPPSCRILLHRRPLARRGALLQARAAALHLAVGSTGSTVHSRFAYRCPPHLCGCFWGGVQEKRSSYAPTEETPVRYDGIYRIVKCWRTKGKQVRWALGAGCTGMHPCVIVRCTHAVVRVSKNRGRAAPAHGVALLLCQWGRWGAASEGWS